MSQVRGAIALCFLGFVGVLRRALQVGATAISLLTFLCLSVALASILMQQIYGPNAKPSRVKCSFSIACAVLAMLDLCAVGLLSCSWTWSSDKSTQFIRDLKSEWGGNRLSQRQLQLEN